MPKKTDATASKRRVDPTSPASKQQRAGSTSTPRLLERLEASKRQRGARDTTRVERLLAQLARRTISDTTALIRFHETLLFLCAYPHSPTVLRLAEATLATFAARVEHLHATGANDLAALAAPDASGIAGTSFSAIYGYDITRHLAARYPTRTEINWDGYESTARLNALLPRLLPLFEEGAYSETPVPFLAWLRAAKRRGERDIAWLIRRFEALDLTDRARAELFDSLRLWLDWEPGDSTATRTRMRRRVRRVFYHGAPLIRRGDVSLARELASPPLALDKLSPVQGRRLLDAGRDAMAVRFRELHGFTHGDPRHVWRAEAGRGVEIFVWGVPPARRLPTLAYHAVFIFKNGVPCGYAEGLTMFERTEIGLNLFNTFRDGESAWIYARLMRLFHQLLGVTVFSVDPYQIGHVNQEGIASGAFWFYRKLGFRPVRPELAALVEREEKRIARRPGYRTPARTLRTIAEGHIIYEMPAPAPDSAHAATTIDDDGNDGHDRRSGGDWTSFHVRHFGLAVQRRMAARFDGDAAKLRRASERLVAHALDVQVDGWNERERRAFSGLAPVLALIPGLARWSADDQRRTIQVVRAKAGAQELRYLALLQQHARLREAFIALGSSDRL